MIVKILVPFTMRVATVVLSVMILAAQALPQPQNASSFKDITAEVIQILGLSLKDTFDYNKFILNMEAVIEESQRVALNAIENTVGLAQEMTKSLTVLGAQQNVKDISSIQSLYFNLFESMRHQAYEQNVDISSCVYPAVQQIYKESQTSVNQITIKLNNITDIFDNYTTTKYIEPARVNLAKGYTIRERIYQCPFSFTDFTPFYLCLAVAAVLEDVVTLNQFTVNFNHTATEVYNLLMEFGEDAVLFRNENVNAFNATAHSVYVNVFVPCAAEKGFNV